jgi:hypothetical protein
MAKAAVTVYEAAFEKLRAILKKYEKNSVVEKDTESGHRPTGRSNWAKWG